MEGANADNVRPPTQTRARSIAQTVHSQAPTLPSKQTEEESSDTSSEGTVDGSKQSSTRAEHEETVEEAQTERQKETENQFLSKPGIVQPRVESRTPARDRPENPKGKALTHPLYTEGLEAIIEQQEKEITRPKTPIRPKANQRQRQPLDRQRKDPSPPKRTPRQQDRGDKRRDPSARKRDPSARKKRKRTPSPKERGRKRDPSAHRDRKRHGKEHSPSRHRSKKQKKEVRLQPRRDKTKSRTRHGSRRKRAATLARRSSSGSRARAEKVEKLSREIRKGVAGKERFSDYPKSAFAMTAEIFVGVGYTSWDKVKTIQQTARDFLLADLRRPENRRSLEDLTLLLDIFDVYECQRKNTNPKDPKYEAVTISEAMRHWKPNMKDLSGNLKPSQDLCNHFSLEIARGKLLSPPVFPYVVPDLSKKPWAVQEPAHTSALESWQKLQQSHKRPGTQDLSINQWFLYNLRYVLAGDLAGAWSPFGGLAAQMNHIGIVLDLAVTEHSGVALSYDLQVKNLAKQMAETDREKNKVEGLLSDLNQTIKNNVLREFGIMPTYTSHKAKAQKGTKDKGRGDKGKGKGKKSDKRGRQRDNAWGKNSQPQQQQQTQQQQNQQQQQQQKTWNNDWQNDWTQQNKPDEPAPDQQQEPSASQKTTAMKKQPRN